MRQSEAELLERALGNRPEAIHVLRQVTFALANGTERRAACAHLLNPSLDARTLAESIGATLDTVVSIYERLRSIAAFRSLTSSIWYPRRLLYRMAGEIVQNLAAENNQDSSGGLDLANGLDVSARVVELHATPAECPYYCAMCPWSDSRWRRGATSPIAGLPVLRATEWCSVIEQLIAEGTQTLIFSGGGEPLLNMEILDVFRFACARQLATQLYTNGFFLSDVPDQRLQDLLRIDTIRVSVHSASVGTYDAIARMPSHERALQKVIGGIERVLHARRELGSRTRIGIGFVIQRANCHEIQAIADLSARLGVDFLNIRQDVLAGPFLHGEGLSVATQLERLLNKIVEAEYGALDIDMADSLTCLVNGVEELAPRSQQCWNSRCRPVISPHGILFPCDLRASPLFYDDNYVLGSPGRNAVQRIARRRKTVPQGCAHCMPSGKSANLVFEKLAEDLKHGIGIHRQPFFCGE